MRQHYCARPLIFLALICPAASILADEPLAIYVGFHKNLGVLTLRSLGHDKVSISLDGEFGESPGGFCGGSFKSIGDREGNKIFVDEPSQDPELPDYPCKMEITMKGKHAMVKETSSCSPYHGACASFDGRAQKVYPKR